MYELCPNQSHRPDTSTQSSSNYEIAPSIPLSLLEQALLKPLSDFKPITIAEIQMMGHRSKDDVSTHFLTSVLLRLVDDPTTIKDYDGYVKAMENNDIIKKKTDVSIETKNDYSNRLKLSTDKVKNYISIKDSVAQYRLKYLDIYENCVDTTAKREFTAEIYEASDHFKHPGLEYIKLQRQQPREEIRSAVIESERIFRLMLIDAADDNSATT